MSATDSDTTEAANHYEQAAAHFRAIGSARPRRIDPTTMEAVDTATGETLFYVDLVAANRDGSIPRDRYSEIQAKVRDERADAPTLLYVADGDRSGFLKFPEVIERGDALIPATGLADRERLKDWYRGRLKMAA